MLFCLDTCKIHMWTGEEPIILFKNRCPRRFLEGHFRPNFYTFAHYSRCLPIVCFHFRVFNKLTELSRPSKLPGLNFTQKQQMWIALTRFWCGGQRFWDESQRYQILREDYDGRYVPNPFRILEPFSNSKEFSQDWNCPKGSKMNRPTKCTIWDNDF